MSKSSLAFQLQEKETLSRIFNSLDLFEILNNSSKLTNVNKYPAADLIHLD